LSDYLFSLINIIIIDLVLSGDNAVVIGMAVHRLPPKQKRLVTLTSGGRLCQI
jgi:predicted tellurium resistance membrane protein TerC